MSDTVPQTHLPADLQPILHQFLETARAMLPGGATQSECEVRPGGQAVVSAAHVPAEPSQSRRVLLFGCVDALRAADRRVVDAELRRLVRTVHVPVGEAVAFEWKERAMKPHADGRLLPEC